MSLANVFLRHRFILERLRVKPHTFEQLEHYWEISEMNIEGQELSQRTLQRDIPIIAAVEISPDFTNSNPAIRLKISVRYTPPENIPLLFPIAEATFL